MSDPDEDEMRVLYFLTCETGEQFTPEYSWARYNQLVHAAKIQAEEQKKAEKKAKKGMR